MIKQGEPQQEFTYNSSSPSISSGGEEEDVGDVVAPGKAKAAEGVDDEAKKRGLFPTRLCGWKLARVGVEGERRQEGNFIFF